MRWAHWAALVPALGEGKAVATGSSARTPAVEMMSALEPQRTIVAGCMFPFVGRVPSASLAVVRPAHTNEHRENITKSEGDA